MPNDQFGRSVSVGDTVVIKGEVTKVLEDPNYLNCTVQLDQKMPPTGTETTLQLNTAQLEKTGGSEDGGKAPKTQTGAGPSPAQAQAARPPEPPKPPEPHKRP